MPITEIVAQQPETILELTIPLAMGAQIIVRFAPPQSQAEMRDVVAGAREVLAYLESVTNVMVLQCACRARIVVPTTMPQDATMRHICKSGEVSEIEMWRMRKD